MREPMGIQTDTKTKEATWERAQRFLTKVWPKATQAPLLLCAGACGGGLQIVAVMVNDGARARVLKWRANSRRWTAPTWVNAADLRAPDPKEKRYRDAYASLGAHHAGLL